MSTWQECIDEVRDALMRGDDISDTLIDSHLYNAQNAILRYNRREWHWLDEIKDAIIATDQTQITEPADIISILGLSISEDNDYYTPLIQYPYAALQVNFNMSERGRPTHFARQGGLFFIFPGTDKQYHFRMHYKRTQNRITGSQTSPLTTKYKYTLIWLACATIAAGVLQDTTLATNYQQLANAQLQWMEDEDDLANDDIYSGLIQPDNYYERILSDGWDLYR